MTGITQLLRWVEGRFLNARLAPQHLHRVGAFTARLHDHAAAFAPPAGFTRGRVARVDAAWETVTLQRVAAARPRGAVALMRATIQQIRATLDSLSQDPAVYGLLHADLHQENYLFHRPEVRAIDFDDCAFGHHLYDLSVTLSEVEHHANFAALRAALLSGYRAVRPLPDGYDMALPALIARRRIDLIMWLIDSREHPGFHDRWGPDVTEELRRLRAFANR